MSIVTVVNDTYEDNEDSGIEFNWFLWTQILNVTNGAVGCIGIGLNLLIIYLSFHLKQETFSTTVLRWLAAYDVIICADYGIRTGILRPLGIEVININDFFCKTVWHSIRWKQYAEEGQICLYTLERVVALFWPIFYRNNATQKLANQISASMLVFYLLITTPYLWFFEVGADNRCFVNAENPLAQLLWRIYALVTTVLLSSVCPIIFIIVCNIVISVKMYRRQKEKKKEVIDNSVTYMLIGVSIVFVICFEAAFAIDIYALVNGYKFSWKKINFLYALANVTKITNSTANFFLYILTNREFRKQLKRIIPL